MMVSKLTTLTAGEEAELRPAIAGSQLGYAGVVKPARTLQKESIYRARDVVIGGLLLVALSPVLLAIALIVRLDSSGPALFVQRRGGQAFKTFHCFKFRTMSVMEDGANVVQAQVNDARITRVGRFLRRSSLDELPQLINVVKGEMSLVGPRPHALAHDRKYRDLLPDYAMRARVKPGMTGLAQIAGLRGECHSDLSMAERVAADNTYIDKRSFTLDFRILILTPLRIIKCTTAY